MGRILKLRGADGNWLEVPAIKGSTGATFTPNVSSEGVLSWVNDKGLKNPDPISIKGPIGSEGATFTPHLSETGDLSWTNDKGLPNPDPVKLTSTDTTLSVPGAPADSKAAGDAIENLDKSIPSWARQEKKPTYSADEVGALAKDGTAVNSDKLGGKLPSEYLGATAQAVDSQKLGGKAPEYYLQPMNLLDNSDFSNPVNQRGATSYSNGYSIDRWSVDGSGSSAVISSSGITVSNASFRQYVMLPAGTYTLVFKVSNGTTLFYNFTYDGTSTLTKTGGANEMTGAYINIYHKSNGIVACQFVLGADYSFTLAWAALYEGSYDASTLPAYQPKGYAVELAECQRYYQVIPALTHISGVTNTTTSFGAKYRIPNMRIAPTVSIASGQEVSIYTGDYSATTANYTTQYDSKPNQITLNISLNAGSFVAYKPGELTFPVDVVLSADL